MILFENYRSKVSENVTFTGRDILNYLLYHRTLHVLSGEIMGSVRCRRVFLHLKPNPRIVIFNEIHV